MAREAKAGVESSILDLFKLPAIDWTLGQRELTPTQLQRIQEMAEVIRAALERDSTFRVEIEGRADANLGSLTPEQNHTLAWARAESIRQTLIGMGIPKRALVAVGRVQWADASGGDPDADRRSTFSVSVAAPTAAVIVSPETPQAAALGASGILVGIGQGLVEEARTQLAEYMLGGAGRRICARAAVYLTRTCAWFEGSTRRGYLPSIATLRSSLDADLAGVPVLWLQDYLLASLPATPDAGKLRQRLGLLYVVYGIEHYLAGESLLDVAAGLPAWLEMTADPAHSVIPKGYQALVVSLPEFAWTSALGNYVQNFEDAQDLLRAYLSPEALSADTAALYALRTVAVVNSEPRVRLMRMLQTGRTLVDAAQSADSIRRLLLDGPAADSASRVVQRSRYEALLRVVSSALVALSPDLSDQSGPMEWSQVAQRGAPHLVSLLSAAAAHDHRSAMQTATALVVDFGRNLSTSPGCLLNERRNLVLQPPRDSKEAAADGNCTTGSDAFSSMPPRTLALLGFVTDVASARTEDEVKHAVRGYVRQQGGARGKRFETGRYYWSVNSYVGLQHLTESLDENEQSVPDRGVSGAYLPVGFEAGVRLGSGRARGLTAGVFLQAVDLGAIALHRPDQEEDQVQAEVGWYRIVAPGMGVMIGLGEIPFSIGFIGSFAPAAREIEGVGDVDALRWGFVAGFDLPIIR
jgi:hypothetical protein